MNGMRSSSDALLSDAEMLPGLRTGDQAAFEALVRGYCDSMYAVALRIVRNEEDAREVLQDAFLRAFRAISGFEGKSRLSTWLHRIVINSALKRLRSVKRDPERSIEEFLPHFTDDEHHDKEPRPFRSVVEESASRKELAAIVHRQIDKLPEPYRMVVVLRDLEGLDTEETAVALETTTTVVKTRLHRARQALRTLLEPYFKEAQR